MLTYAFHFSRSENVTKLRPLVALGFLAFLIANATASRAWADYPIASHRYLADPGSLFSGGRVYLYNSNDDDNAIAGPYQMKSIVCVSSSDLKNWTDHGEVFRVPRDAAWAGFSWAPYVVERGGKFFLYFGNNAGGIGVASSTSPTGPFKDAKGSALVDSSTPGATGTNSWLFDPGVLIDDDGQAYLYFGGNGMTNARVIPLGADMIRVTGPAIALAPPSFFEASFIFKRNGLYYFAYSTDPSAGQRIDYMTSTSPTSGFQYRGTIGPQPPSNSNNNQASEFLFNGAWYHAYHNRYVANQAGISNTFRRNLGLEGLTYNADGTIQPVVYTQDGVQQLGNVNPYVRVEAEMFNAQSGIETEPSSAGGMDLTAIDDGDWIRVRGVDFGSAGAQMFMVRVASAGTGGGIELHLGSATGTLAGTCTVPGTGGAQTWTTVTCGISGATGVQDLYLVFRGSGSMLFNVDFWQFVGGDGGATMDAGSGDLPDATASDAPVGTGDASPGNTGSGGRGGVGGEGGGGNPAADAGTGPSVIDAGSTGGNRSGAGCACATGGGAGDRSASVILLVAAAWVIRGRRVRRAAR